MASDIKAKYGTSTALTITLNSLAHSTTAGRQSTVVDNSSDLALDAHVTVIAAMAAGTPGVDKAIYVFAFGSEDGTNYGDPAGASDAAITLRSPTNLRLIGVISTPDAGALTYKSQPMSVAAAFGGILPRKWGIVVQNMTNVAFASSGCSASYTPMQQQVV